MDQFSDRQLTTRKSLLSPSSSTEDFINVKGTIHNLFMHYLGIGGPRRSVLALSNEPNVSGAQWLIFVDKLRVDDAAFTVVLDVAVLPLTTELLLRMHPAMQALTAAYVAVGAQELAGWKRLMPALVERCRTWSHRETCEYAVSGKVPVSVEVDEVPLCECGRGVNLSESLKNIPGVEQLLPYATRAAISPLFAVSYLERVAGKARETIKHQASWQSASPAISGMAMAHPTETCRKCHGPGKPKLLACGKCKTAKYCSTECQRADWKAHKQTCKAA